MAKKCIPGLFCVGNMTLFVLCLTFISILYLILQVSKPANITVIHPGPSPSNSSYTPFSMVSDIHTPPLKLPDIFGLSSPSTPSVNIGNTVISPVPESSNLVPMAVQVPTRGYPSAYQQIGILTSDSRQDMILPLMGRRTTTARDKWQYYTTSNSGSIQTKLPVSLNGRSCTSDTGCNEIFNNDTVYVEGYKDVFRATVYENMGLSYNPVL